MVSTRGIKLKFTENERVLCYEPDPTKAKVLYDSKVLNVVVNKDHRGRKTVEYLIHFQGWNSSWDRYVSEEYILKDTPENRQLQKDLAEQSQLQLGAYLYRRDRKKHRSKQSDRTTIHSSDDGSSGSPIRMDTDDGHIDNNNTNNNNNNNNCRNESSSSEDDSSIDEESIPIELTQELREILELDYNLINFKNKLIKLPAEPNVVNILESYWKHYVTNQICDLNEKLNNSRSRYPYTNQTRRRPEDIHRNLNICKEVLDGLRIYFDFTVNDLLLYKSEHGQIQTKQAHYTSPFQLEKDDNNTVKHEIDFMDYNHFTNSVIDEEFNESRPLTRRRTLRSNKSLDSCSNGATTSDSIDGSKTFNNNGRIDQSNSMSKLLSWRLLPEHVYNQQPLPPCLIYGAVHLRRLFVKLPELLNASNIEENKLKVLLQHLDSFIEFLNDHKEWFGEKCYVDK